VKKKIKELIRQLHLILGLASGVVVFIVAITGCIYCFEEEIRTLRHKELLFVTAEGSSLPLSAQINVVKNKYPKQAIKNIRLKNKADASTEIILKNKESVFVNPYTGIVLGSYNKDTDFLGVVLKLHRSLLMNEPGKIITGSSALIFLVMIISGIILWWPKGKRSRKQKFRISSDAPAFRRIYDLHSVLGFYASVLLLFSVLTGLIWSFKWFEAGMYFVTGSKKEERKMLHSEKSAAGMLPADKFMKATEFLYNRSSECFINLPEDKQGVFRINFVYPSTGFFRKQDQITFDQYSGKILKAQIFEKASNGDKIKATNYNIHTGKVLGLPGQVLMFFASLIAASLPVTGFMMWWKKRKLNQLVAEKRK
jgi:uncharacterized iron-regulated membrane protein